jgi:hypothetical protein
MLEERILAVITTTKERIGGGAPIFICDTEEEMHEVAFQLERCLDSSVHEISPTLLIVVKHHG